MGETGVASRLDFAKFERKKLDWAILSGKAVFMPDYIHIAERAAAGLLESKLASRLAAEAMSLLEAAGAKEISASLNPRSLGKIVKSFPEEIPETLGKTLSLKGESALSTQGRITTVLTPHLDQKLGIGLRELSEHWSQMPRFSGSRLGVKAANGELMLPELLINSELPGQGARASWVNGRVRMGESAFRAPFSAEISGIAVHEATHHEQAYLALCRKADKLGIGLLADSKSAAADQVSSLLAQLEPFHMGMNDKTVSAFLEFRAGNKLSKQAASRAEQLLASNQDLFGLPFNHASLSSQLAEAAGFKAVLKKGTTNAETKALLTDFANAGKREIMVGKLYGSEAEKIASELAQGIPAATKGSFTGPQYERLSEIFSNTLNRAEKTAEQKKSIWQIVYQDALHEREARFNQYIAQESLADFLAGKGLAH